MNLRKALLAATALAAAAQVTPAFAGTDNACGGTLNTNCGQLSVTVTVNEASCTRGSTYSCPATLTATAQATGWLTPGDLELFTQCGSQRASWTILGTTAPETRTCHFTVSTGLWQCGYASGSATVRFTAAAGKPRDLSASDSYRFCDPTPIPTGAKVRLYEHSNFGGGSFTVSGDIADFNGRTFSNFVSLNDRVSSLQVRSDCSAVLWSDAGYSGTPDTRGPGDHLSIGTMNDRASSIDIECVFN